jgi:predicted heme/steroid binding protein/uncharacterized membrane protein
MPRFTTAMGYARFRYMREREFTREELAGFDGKDGQPAYVAVDGVVYDASASALWRGGNHVRAHDAGADLSREITMAPHPKDRLERLVRVGVVKDPAPPPPVTAPEPVPFLAALAYKLHAHPASVHFPIALCAVAAVLNIVGRITGYEVLETAALINLILGLTAAPVSILSGLLDWRYQYGGRLTGLFAWKLGLSFSLLALGAIALGLRMGGGGLAYDAVLTMLAPMVLGLGLVGGRITFPSN